MNNKPFTNYEKRTFFSIMNNKPFFLSIMNNEPFFQLWILNLFPILNNEPDDWRIIFLIMDNKSYEQWTLWPMKLMSNGPYEYRAAPLTLCKKNTQSDLIAASAG